MAAARPVAPCHLCAQVTSLSFEHVPPQSAFNNRPIWALSGERVIAADLEHLPRGRQHQRGSGGYTLCERCNNDTGAWYVPAFAEWTRQAAHFVLASEGRDTQLHLPYHIYPLRVLKQVACMFFSVNAPGLSEEHGELVRFVLNREAYGLPEKYRIYAYLNTGSRSRQVGLSGILNTTSGQIRVLSEISFPPIGYVMCLSSEPPDTRLVDITFFSRYLYNDFGTVSLRMPVLPVFTYFPGDFRDQQTTLKERDINRHLALSHQP
jgi:hypothetical protein